MYCYHRVIFASKLPISRPENAIAYFEESDKEFIFEIGANKRYFHLVFFVSLFLLVRSLKIHFNGEKNTIKFLPLQIKLELNALQMTWKLSLNGNQLVHKHMREIFSSYNCYQQYDLLVLHEKSEIKREREKEGAES